MSRRPFLITIVAWGFFTMLALPVFAQVGGIPSPYGSSPFSPWLNLNQKQGGPLDPYHMFVQPSLQLNNALQVQQAGIQRNAAGLGGVSDRLMTDMEAMRTGPGQTGMGAGFMNHTVYFNTYRRNGQGAGMMGAGMTGGGMAGGGMAGAATIGAGITGAGTTGGGMMGAGNLGGITPPRLNTGGARGL